MPKKMLYASILLLAVGLVGATMLPASAQRLAVVNPVQSQNASPASDSLRLYEDISALPLALRKGYFRSTSATNRSDLWKIHLALQLAKQPDLNSAQQGIILEAIALATPELFNTSRDAARAATSEAVQSLRKRAPEVFSKRQMAEIFFTLGNGGCRSCSDSELQNEVGRNVGIKSARTQLASFERGSNTGHASDLPVGLAALGVAPFSSARVPPDCSCNMSSCHGWGYDYCGKNNGCTRTSWGCGLFWLDECSGNYCGMAPAGGAEND
jgi:hypothetical protein